MTVQPSRDRASGIDRCAVCDGYMRRFDSYVRTCADTSCPGHATGGVLTDEIAAAERVRIGMAPQPTAAE